MLPSSYLHCLVSIQQKHPPMEAKCLSRGQRSSSNTINTLPQSIIETILCLVPIEEAARTSILSRDWRYKWTTIPKLVFDESTMCGTTTETEQTSDIRSARKNMDKRCKIFYVIYQVLLIRQGPIHEFTLRMHADKYCFEIDQIILNLSRNHTLKNLKLFLYNHDYYKLPLCAFSMHQLTDLDLECIDLDHQPTFSGFCSLKSLRLNFGKISTKALLHLLSKCPSLTSFYLSTKVEPAGDCTVIELFECLPVIERLTIYVPYISPWLTLDRFSKKLPTSLVHLKYLDLKEVWLLDDELRFLAVFMKCSPNLEKIKLVLYCDEVSDDEMFSGILEEYSDVRLEHLIDLEIGSYSHMEHEFEFVKVILARSPKLKKIYLSGLTGLTEDDPDPVEVLEALLQAPRLSSVEIIVE